MSSIEEKITQKNKLPDFYKRYVDDTIAQVLDLPTASNFLTILMMCNKHSN